MGVLQSCLGSALQFAIAFQGPLQPDLPQYLTVLGCGFQRPPLLMLPAAGLPFAIPHDHPNSLQIRTLIEDLRKLGHGKPKDA